VKAGSDEALVVGGGGGGRPTSWARIPTGFSTSQDFAYSSSEVSQNGGARAQNAWKQAFRQHSGRVANSPRMLIAQATGAGGPAHGRRGRADDKSL